MRSLRVKLLTFLALAAMAPTFAFSAASVATDRVIVKWRDAGSATRIGDEKVAALAERRGRRLAPGRVIGGGMSVVKLDRERTGADLDALIADLRADPAVELVVPDRRVKALAYVPSDPLFATGQWYLKAAQPAAIRADAAWDVTKGGNPANSVVVAVLDTGIRADHPDLAGKLVPGFDFVNLPAAAGDGDGWDADPSDEGDFITAAELASGPFSGHKCGGGTNEDQPTDSTWHGTRVAGMIAASTDNGAGVAGAGFNIRVQPVRVLAKCGGFNSDVLAGMYWAAGLAPPLGLVNLGSGGVMPPVNATPAQIINMSLGSADACDAMYTQAVADITAHGVLIVASAGNDGKDVGSPANCPGVMAVAGVRHVGTKVGFSDLGPAVAISAPGGNCVNTAPGSPCLFSLDTTTNLGLTTPGANGYTDALNPNVGTSFASPLVAAVAGLMKTVNPSLSPAALIARMKASARPFPTTSDTVPAPPACHLPTGSTDVQNSECICNTQVCGAGLLFAPGAVNEALRPIALAEVSGALRAGNIVTLDGSKSGVAAGRTATYLWSVVSAASGASTPVITQSMQSVASVPVQANGTVVFRLTVTDNLGASDTADVTIAMAAATGGASTTAPPPSTSTGGGGAYSWPLLLITGALLFARRRRQLAR